MDFGGALKALHAGECVARAGWNGKGMFIFRVPGSTFIVNRAPLLGIFAAGTQIDYLPHTDMFTADKKVVPWLASQTDIEAGDWELVAKPSVGASGASELATPAVAGASVTGSIVPGPTGPVAPGAPEVAAPIASVAPAAPVVHRVVSAALTPAQLAAATTASAAPAPKISTSWVIRKKPAPKIFTPSWWDGTSTFVADVEKAYRYTNITDAQTAASKIGQPVEIVPHAFAS